MMTNKNNYGLDILFVSSVSNSQSMYMPAYFLYLCGYLEKHNYRTGISDPHNQSIKENYAQIIREIKKKNPRYIGLAVFATDYDAVTELAKTIKIISDATILVGNAQPSIAPEDFLYPGSPFDVVVRGEGELTLRQLLLEYEYGKDNSGIKGIAYIENGAVKINADRGFMDLSECGMPSYEKLDMNWYSRPTKTFIRRLPASCAVIYIGRGCPYRCAFCAANTVWRANAAARQDYVVRKRPLADVISELEILQNKYKFDFFYIQDDTFGAREEDIYDFCRAYSNSGLRMLWAADTRSNCVQKKDVVKTMRDAGCIQLDFGVETGSPDLLKVMRKGITVEETVRAFSLCRVYGLRTLANILLNSPGETKNDLALTRVFLKKIKPTVVSIGIAQPYPGTEFFDKYITSSITKEEYSRLDRFNPMAKTRMASHKMNLSKLLLGWQLKYGMYGPIEWNIFQTDRRYWQQVIRSPRRLAYLRYFIETTILRPLLQSIKYTYIYLTKP